MPDQKEELRQRTDEKAVSKVRKKVWVPILAPKLFNEAFIGETNVYEPHAAIGKTVTQNLMGLMNDSKKQNINAKFAIDSVENNKAKTRLIAFELIPATVKRLVRRSCTKIELSFPCITSDNIRMLIKPLLITKNEAVISVRSKIVNMAKSFLRKKIKSETYESVVNGFVTHKLQDSLKAHLNKIYPLRTCEIMYAGIEEEKKPVNQK
jgi:ribosomal protein S3AE